MTSERAAARPGADGPVSDYPESDWSETLERSALDALPRAVIVTSPDGRILLWNRTAEQLYGWAEHEVLGRSVMEVLVPTAERALANELLSAVLAGERWQGDFPVVRRDGQVVRAFVVDTPIVDRDGSVVAIVGASEDVTDQRLFEQEAADVAAHLALALDAGGLGTWRWDMATGQTVWDAKLESLFGLEPGTFPGTFEAYAALLHPDDAPAVLATVERAVAERSRYTVDHRVVWPDGSVHWLQGKGQVTVDASGAVTGTRGCVGDITEHVDVVEALDRAVAAARDAADTERLAAERLRFLADVNDALNAAPTRADVMRDVTRAAVPRLGDWCAIFVLPTDGERSTPDIEIAHVDPDKVAYVRSLQERFPYDPDAPTGAAAVIRTGQTQFYPDLDDDVLATLVTTDEERAIVRSLGLRSALAVPLVKRGRVVGALQLMNSDSSRSYTHDDVLLAEVVASRVAATLENRRLDDHQRAIARTLQASLLPERLPRLPGADLAVRYWPAGEGNIVGGDFYDVFEIAGGWAIVIGDVCGTGPAAASLTGLARHTIRAAAWNARPPVEVLSLLNHAIRRSGRETFCTALYCTLASDGSGYQFTVAAGGHPLPLVRRTNGDVETIGVPGTLLGLFEESRTTTTATRLLPGDTLVLYTDGITDVAPPHDTSPEQLRTMVGHAAAADESAEAIVERIGLAINSRLSFEQRQDDIALLVLTIDPEPGR